ncbi:UDP-N-acetylmuramoyl-L-alanine--D-glutamate ligase [Peptoniphilus mikwangii]|uniref:UDP-N-acetylmuramoyl-L-alanine--D-glutamate ligase n=1 Tax=Peptoniphilus mikwangii TaxID=1354300 RepID=UPI000411F0CA|nr:UDP-N-acetylmuramoyl-L-alanine--D-glutamate ligase [Peptoniphilus mikwangii]
MYEYKNILIFGLGVTGESALKCMSNFECNLYAYDENEDNLNKDFEIDFKIFNKKDIDKIDLIIKSPGINPKNEILMLANEKNIKVVSDIEIAYGITKCKNLIAITGTNGKTTTTSLTYQILNNDRKTYCVGNIGKGILDIALEAEEDDYIVIEASSFQLEYTYDFKPIVSVITNVTSDHLDWHGNISNYKNAKYKIFKNQNEDDYTIFNYRDQNLKSLSFDRDIYYFSLEDSGKLGTFVKEGGIYFRSKDSTEFIMSVNDIKMPGVHNVENVLASTAIAKSLGIKNEVIKKSISNFMGVEHRIEFVRELNGVKYYNDSKGTNPDSTIMAINAIEKNIILIAGGYDKKADFSEMLNIGLGKVKKLILLGETADILQKISKPLGYEIYMVNDLDKAVMLSNSIASSGDVVLLSPACASWDMYTSYEKRGEHFKKLVNELI